MRGERGSLRRAGGCAAACSVVACVAVAGVAHVAVGQSGAARASAAAGVAAAAGSATAERVGGFGTPVTVRFSRPTKDTSTYINIGPSANTRPFVWANAYPGEGRQSNVLAMFNTGSRGVPTGNAAARVIVTRALVTACTYISGPSANYDPDADPWQSNLWPGGPYNVLDANGGTQVVDVIQTPADPRYIDLGPLERGNAPVELFAARFNNGLSAAAWVESVSGTPGVGAGGVPNAEPIDFDTRGNERAVTFNTGEDALNLIEALYPPPNGPYLTLFPDPGQVLRPNPADGFDPRPLAIGESYDIPDGTAGHSIFGTGQVAVGRGEPLGFAHRLRFEVRTSDPTVQAYLRSNLREGWVSVFLSQLAFGDLSGGEYSRWLTKEGSSTLPPGVVLEPTTLEFDYVLAAAGDIDLDGEVGVRDLLEGLGILLEPGAAGADEVARVDLDESGALDVFDLFMLLEAVDAGAAGAAGNGRVGR